MEFAVPVTPKSNVLHVTSLEHRLGLINDSNVFVVKLSAQWCKPCQRIIPDYNIMANLFKDNCVFTSEDIDEDFGDHPVPVKSIPAFHFYKEGTFVKEIVGANLENVFETLVELCEKEKENEKENENEK